MRSFLVNQSHIAQYNFNDLPTTFQKTIVEGIIFPYYQIFSRIQLHQWI